MASKTQTIIHERMSCSTWSEYFGSRGSDIDIKPIKEDEESKSFSSKLREVDTATYGLCPLWEICSLLVCSRCNKIVKFQCIKSHMESHGVTQPPPNLEPTSLSGSDLITPNLSNNQSFTHGAKSTATELSIKNNNHATSNQSSQETSDHNFLQENIYLPYNNVNSAAFVQHTLPHQDLVPSSRTQLPVTDQEVITNFQTSVIVNEVVTKGRSRKKDIEYNPNVHCGVLNEDGLRCTRLISCQKHYTTEKVLVPGRSNTFKELLRNYRAQKAKNKVALSTKNVASVVIPNFTKSPLLNQGEATDIEYDPNIHCGVLDKDTGFNCTHHLSCKKHQTTQKRLVSGRSKSFKVLLQNYNVQSDRNKVALPTNNVLLELPNLAKSPLLNQEEVTVNHKPPVITFLSVPPKPIINIQDRSMVLDHLRIPDFDTEHVKSKEIDQVRSNHDSSINLKNNITIGNPPSIHRLEAPAAMKTPENRKEKLLALAPETVIISELSDTRTKSIIPWTEPLIRTEPIMTRTEPISTRTELITTRTEPIITSTEPIITRTEPIITRTEPFITRTETLINRTEPTNSRIESIVRTDTTNKMGPVIDSFSRIQRRLNAAIRSKPKPDITEDDPPYICRPPRPSAVCTYGIRQDRGILLLNQRSNRLKASLESLLPAESSNYHPYFKKFCVKSPVAEPIALDSSNNLCSNLTTVSSPPESISASSVTSHNFPLVRTQSTTNPVLFSCISTEDRTLSVPQSSKMNNRTNKAHSESNANTMYLPQTLKAVPNGVISASHLIPNHVENTLQLATSNFQCLDNIQFPFSLTTNSNIIRNLEPPHNVLQQAPNGQVSSGFNIRDLLKDKFNVPSNYSSAQTFGATSSTGHLPHLQPQPSQTLIPYNPHLHLQTHTQSNTSISFQKKSGRTSKSKSHRNSAPYNRKAEDNSPMSGHFPTIHNGFPPPTQSFIFFNQLPVSPNSNPATDQSSSESTNSVPKEGKSSNRLLLPSNLKITEAVCINGWISASTRLPAAP